MLWNQKVYFILNQTTVPPFHNREMFSLLLVHFFFFLSFQAQVKGVLHVKSEDFIFFLKPSFILYKDPLHKSSLSTRFLSTTFPCFQTSQEDFACWIEELRSITISKFIIFPNLKLPSSLSPPYPFLLVSYASLHLHLALSY